MWNDELHFITIFQTHFPFGSQFYLKIETVEKKRVIKAKMFSLSYFYPLQNDTEGKHIQVPCLYPFLNEVEIIHQNHRRLFI